MTSRGRSHRADSNRTGEPTAKERLWAVVRLVLGQAQMIGAVASFYLLFQGGMNELSLGMVAFTCLCTTVSVLLFGGGKRGG